MHLLLLLVTILTISHQYKCLSITHSDNVEEDIADIRSRNNNNLARFKQPEGRFVSIVNINPFNEPQGEDDKNTMNQWFEHLLKLINSVKDRVGIIEGNLPYCPSNVPRTAIALGTYCYWMVTTPLTLHNAHKRCVSEGGTIAEPFPNFSLPFSNALKKEFRPEFRTIENNSLWLGADNYNDLLDEKNRLGKVFLYLTTNLPVPYQTVKPTDHTKQYGATLTTTGSWVSAVASDLHPTVCQSSTLSKNNYYM